MPVLTHHTFGLDLLPPNAQSSSEKCSRLLKLTSPGKISAQIVHFAVR